MPKGPTGQPRGRRPGEGGRPKGVRNVWSQRVREELMAAFEAKGGRAYLEKLADEHPAVFAGMLSKILPTEMRAELSAHGVVDLGVALAHANARLEQLSAPPPVMIEAKLEHDNDE